jgi:hypothetical protein
VDNKVVGIALVSTYNTRLQFQSLALPPHTTVYSSQFTRAFLWRFLELMELTNGFPVCLELLELTNGVPVGLELLELTNGVCLSLSRTPELTNGVPVSVSNSWN